MIFFSYQMFCLFFLSSGFSSLAGCAVWTGFTVGKNIDNVAKSIKGGQFPFSYGFFVAWLSWILSIVAAISIHCFRRRK